jgi:nucleolar protein 12
LAVPSSSKVTAAPTSALEGKAASGEAKKSKKARGSKGKEIDAEDAPAVSEAGPSSASAAPKSVDNDADLEEVEHDEDADEDEDEDEDEDAKSFVHESLKTTKKKQKTKPAKAYIPPNESQADRDRRTIFVGNLPIDVASSKVRSPPPTCLST